MRLNKIEKDLKLQDLKLNFSKFWTKVKIFVGGSFLVANIAACTPAVEDVDATSMAPTTTTESVVPSSSEEVTPSTEVVDSTEVTPSTDVVEPTETTEVVEDTITAEEAYVFVTNVVNENGENAYSKYIPTLYFAANYDKFTEEERENYQNLFGLSDEDLDNNYLEFMKLQYDVVTNIMNYNAGDNVSLKYSLDDIMKIESIVVDEKDKESAKNVDDHVIALITKGDGAGKYVKQLRDNAASNEHTTLDLFYRDFVLSVFKGEFPTKSIFSAMPKVY